MNNLSITGTILVTGVSYEVGVTLNSQEAAGAVFLCLHEGRSVPIAYHLIDDVCAMLQQAKMIAIAAGEILT